MHNMRKLMQTTVLLESMHTSSYSLVLSILLQLLLLLLQRVAMHTLQQYAYQESTRQYAYQEQYYSSLRARNMLTGWQIYNYSTLASSITLATSQYQSSMHTLLESIMHTTTSQSSTIHIHKYIYIILQQESWLYQSRSSTRLVVATSQYVAD